MPATTRSFTGTPGDTDPAAQTITITNTGGGTLDDLSLGTIVYTGSGSNWLTAGLDQLSAPATLTLSVATGALALGTYSAALTVESGKADNSPVTVTVTFTPR